MKSLVLSIIGIGLAFVPAAFAGTQVPVFDANGRQIGTVLEGTDVGRICNGYDRWDPDLAQYGAHVVPGPCQGQGFTSGGGGYDSSTHRNTNINVRIGGGSSVRTATKPSPHGATLPDLLVVKRGNQEVARFSVPSGTDHRAAVARQLGVSIDSVIWESGDSVPDPRREREGIGYEAILRVQ